MVLYPYRKRRKEYSGTEENYAKSQNLLLYRAQTSETSFWLQ